MIRDSRWTSRAQTLRAGFDGGAVREGMLSRQQHVRDTGECEYIVPRVRILAFEQLTACIAGGGDRLSRRFAPHSPSVAEYLVRGAEVQDPQFTAIRDEDILRIDVSMHDAARMSVGERGADSAHVGGRIGRA